MTEGNQKPNYGLIATTESTITDDPVIERMFPDLSRTIREQTENNPELEKEKRHKMYTMLRWSKRYRKTQVQMANELWGLCLEQEDEVIDTVLEKILNAEEEKNQKHRHQHSVGLTQDTFLPQTSETQEQDILLVDNNRSNTNTLKSKCVRFNL